MSDRGQRKTRKARERERGANDDDDGQKTRAHVIIVIYCLEKKTRCKTGVVMGAVYDNYGARASSNQQVAETAAYGAGAAAYNNNNV